MRILLTQNTAEMGGVPIYMLELSRRLIENGHEVHLITGNGDLIAEYQTLGVKLTILSPSIDIDPVYIWKLSKYIKQNRIEIVQANMLKSVVNGLLASKIVRAPIIVNMHGALADWEVARFKKFLNVHVNRIITNLFASKVIAISNAVKTILVDEENIKPSLIDVIHNGVDTKLLRPGKNSKLREKLNLGKDTTIIGYLGRLSEEKGVLDIILVAAELKKLNVKAVVVVAGSGPAENELRKRVKELSLEQMVFFVGYVESQQRSATYNSFDLFLFPSKRDGFGLTLAEAMSSGLPALAFDIPVVHEIIDNGINGVIVKNRDTAKMAKEIQALIADNRLISQMSQAAHEKATQCFSLERMVSKTETLYANVLARDEPYGSNY